MQDITGRFALPLTPPFSDVPPPYGRCRSAGKKRGGPGPRVFDLCSHGISREQAKASAADFGSGNAAWLRQRPASRSLRRTLAVGLAFAASCCLATHMLENRRAQPSPETIYRGEISGVSTRQSAPARVSGADNVEVELGLGLGLGQNSHAMSRHEVSHREPVRYAAAPTAVTKAHNRGGHTSVRTVRTNVQSKAKHGASVERLAEGLDMTDAEFVHWREATRDHPFRREPVSEQGEWYFDSINHPRLIPN
ncbi:MULTISPECIES: hypothetical protein [Burkholderia cepacia complex]|uniref:Uncharacterized protein n=2 Tax=Burkholderia cepacia complex TaxID=87882 RepID=B1K3F0_BURO0|nr:MULTISPECIES: hypothetical protein [Burkholderia cepacia complex]ACA93829.1 hypothetical protein Bcenmc03_4698 [Burkholderia orbicola MC0-3]MCA8085834.1 hypothetical protein [Burkholderia cenocepacia]